MDQFKEELNSIKEQVNRKIENSETLTGDDFAILLLSTLFDEESDG